MPKKSSDGCQPIIIFGGKNGSGKTTLLEAFKICLYGDAFKGQKMPKSLYNKHIVARIHRNPDGTKATTTSITLTFDYPKLGVIDNYKVTRTWNYNGTLLIETLAVIQNNEALKEADEEQWQNFLIELIPPGLSKLFLFDGEKIQSLSRGQGENQHIIGSINSLLGLDLIEDLRYDVKTFIAKESAGDPEKFERKLFEVQKQRKIIETEIDSFLQTKANLQNKISRINIEIESQEQAISTAGGGFASQREEYKQKAKELEGKIETIKEQIRTLCAELLPFTFTPQLCLTLKNRLKNEEKVQQRQAALAYLNLAANDLTKDISNALFLDALKLSKDEKELVASEAIKTLRNRLQQMNGSPKESIHAISSLERRDLLRWIETALSRAPFKLEELTSSLIFLESEAKTINGYISNAPSDELLKPYFIKLGELHEELGRELQNQANIEKVIEANAKQLKISIDEQEKLLEEKTQFDKHNRKIQLGIKAQKVIEDYLQETRNEKITAFKDNFLECFNLLIGKDNLIGNATVSITNFNITLFTPHGDPLPKSELSAGERQIYAMAMIWALAKTSGRQLPFMIDTPLGRLDIDHRRNVLKNFLANASHQIIIFSTNTEVDQPYFNLLYPNISKAYSLEYNPPMGKTTVREGYFWKNTEAQQ